MHTRAPFVVTMATIFYPALATASEPCPERHIQAHLRAVAAELRAADTSSHLDPTRRARRARHLAVLDEYTERCEFPRNSRYQGRLVTIFVDDDDVDCAVGYLMARDGRKDLVEHIRATRNTASIWELEDDPEVVRWIAGSGFTLFELARIQPSYCERTFGGSCLCGGPWADTDAPVIGIAEGTIIAIGQDPQYDFLFVDVAIDRVHGAGAHVGDIVRTGHADGDVVGRRALLQLPETTVGNLVNRGPEWLDDSQVQCTSGYNNDPEYCAKTTIELYIAAMLSEDCIALLSQSNPDLGRSVCGLGGSSCHPPDVAEPPPEEGPEPVDGPGSEADPEPAPEVEPLQPGVKVSSEGCVGGGMAGYALLLFGLWCPALARSKSRAPRAP